MVKLVIESLFWSGSIPLMSSVEKAEGYSNCEKFGVIVEKMVESALRINSGRKVSIDAYENVIKDSVSEWIRNSEVVVVIGTNNSEDFAQCSVSGGIIYINSAWLSFIQRLYEKGKSDVNQFNVHKTLLIVKILHEICHLFTPKILELEYKLRKRAYILDSRVPITPLEMGFNTAIKGITRCGDMGFFGEEMMSGSANVRYYPSKITSGIPWDFHTINLVKYNIETKTIELMESINLSNMIDLITGSGPAILTDFEVILIDEKPQMSDKHLVKKSPIKRYKKAKILPNYMDPDCVVGSKSDSDSSRSDVPANFSPEFGVLECASNTHSGRKA